MPMRNCRRCKKIFNYIPGGPKICPECRQQTENDFKKVKEYIYENKGCSINEVSEATGVSTREIMHFLREERLEVSEGLASELKCEKCGRPIKSGRLCKECMESFKKSVGKLTNTNKEDRKENISTKSSKMHIDSLRRR